LLNKITDADSIISQVSRMQTFARPHSIQLRRHMVDATDQQNLQQSVRTQELWTDDSWHYNVRDL